MAKLVMMDNGGAGAASSATGIGGLPGKGIGGGSPGKGIGGGSGGEGGMVGR